jgi:mono/diheme cytochrome c family protein
MNLPLAQRLCLATAAIVIAAVPVNAAQRSASPPEPSAQRSSERELIPGAYLMTPEEREQYRSRIERAPDVQEKARIRAEHFKAMDERARSLGLALRDAPPASKGDVSRGGALHKVCFSCHGPERYAAAKARATSFFTDALIAASGVEPSIIADAGTRAPATLPQDYPKMGRAQVRDLAGLRRAILRWNDYFNPKLSEQELEDLVAYLNAAYYKF